jgi:phosphomevalonate kinase
MAVVVEASAPGKLFLLGEWAVLGGAPALVAAVDRRVHVRLTAAGGRGPLVIESLAEGVRSTVASLGEPAGGDAGAVAAAVAAVAGGRLSDLGARVQVDSRAFLAGGRKLGLGRSAATLVAATSAALVLGGGGPDDHLLATALVANARFQGGRGSGADVAAAVHGGLLEVRRHGDGLAVGRRRLPDGLCLVVGWTGEPAPTAPLLDRFAAATRRRPAALETLAEVAGRGARAVAEGDAAALLAAVDRSADLLACLGDETGVPIMTPALARLIAAARRAGATAKPSGAGAGDCGIALADSPARAAAVERAWRAAGIVPLALAITADGARRTVGDEADAKVAGA